MAHPTDALRKRAEAGEPRAQYELAARLSTAGDAAGADVWLRRAADGGEPDAAYTLATRALQTSKTAPGAAAQLSRAAAKGSAVAARLLGVLYADGIGVSTSREKAVDLVMAAARKGDPAAACELAMLAFAQDPNDTDGAALIAGAAPKNPVAAAVLVRRAGAGLADRATAEVALASLKRARYPNAADLESAIGSSNDMAAPPLATVDWDGLRKRICNLTTHAAANMDTVSARPDAKIYRGVFSLEECEYVIASAASRLAPSLTVDPRTGAARRDAYRTSLTATLGPVDLDLALVMISERLAAIAGHAPETGEFLSVLSYARGQEYKPHFDWLPEGPDLERGGQRVATALFYLNDSYDGGETRFLETGVDVKGRPGDVLVFRNVTAEGAPDRASRHASLPVTNGVKWIASKWFRASKYAF